MVVYDSTTNRCKLYEIKHSTAINKRQTRYLTDETCCEIVEKCISPIDGKYVLYRGENTVIDDVEYLNVEQYLCDLKK